MFMDKIKKQAFKDYVDFKKTSVSSKSAIEGYDFVKPFLSSTKKPLREFNEVDLINYINSISKRYSIGSMNRIKSLIHSFCFWYFVCFLCIN